MPDDLLLLPVISTIVFLLLAGFIVSFTLLFQRRQLDNWREKQALIIQFEQATLQSQIEIQDQTLQSVSHELHDNVGQILTVARLYLNNLEEANLPTDSQEIIIQSNELVNQALHALRDLSKSLNNAKVKEFGLVASVNQELKRLDQSKKFITNFTLRGVPYSLGDNAEIILYRIVQESLTNAIKYAQATTLTVTMEYLPAMFSLAITDNGIGFDYAYTMSKQIDNTGLGLRNIQRRVELMSGICEIESLIGIGTTICIRKYI